MNKFERAEVIVLIEVLLSNPRYKKRIIKNYIQTRILERMIEYIFEEKK